MSVQCTLYNSLCPSLDVQCNLDLCRVYELSLLCMTHSFNILQTRQYYKIKTMSKIIKTQTISRKIVYLIRLDLCKSEQCLLHAHISPLTTLRLSGCTQLTCGVAQVVTTSGSVSPLEEPEQQQVVALARELYTADLWSGKSSHYQRLSFPC